MEKRLYWEIFGEEVRFELYGKGIEVLVEANGGIGDRPFVGLYHLPFL